MRRLDVTLLQLAGTAALLSLPAACGGRPASDLASRVASVCSSTSNLSTEMCACVGREAATTLTPAAQRLLVALLEKDQAAIEAAGQTAAPTDAVAAGTFMARAPATCAKRLANTEAP